MAGISMAKPKLGVTCMVTSIVFTIVSVMNQPQFVEFGYIDVPRELSNSKTKNADPDALDCKTFLQDYRAGKVEQMETEPGWEKSYVTRTKTPNPFYWSTHNPELDTIRSSSFEKSRYYEIELSKRIMEVFDETSSKNQKSIFLDVGGNVGWFSLLAAAHGASEVFIFEPNPANNVRTCESMVLNGWTDYDHNNIAFNLIPKGVGKKNATLDFFKTSISNPGTYSFNRKFEGINNIKRLKELRRKVPPEKIVGKFDVVTLDDFARSRGWFQSKPSIGFFKLDVESFELDVLEGAKELLQSGIIETYEMEVVDQTKADVVKMMDIIFTSGYELVKHGGWQGPHKIVEKKYQSGKELADDINDKVYQENLLFRRRSNY